MSRVIFLLEEYSMKALLDGLLPRLFPTLSFLCVPHDGKKDLEKGIARKLKAWREPGARFIVMRDNDGEDCGAVKAQLLEQCRLGNRTDTKVRIVCQELESWYFGSPAALAAAFRRTELGNLGTRARFRDPDRIQQPSRALVDLVPEFQKVGGARLMSQLLTRDNRSRSFQQFVVAVEQLAAIT